MAAAVFKSNRAAFFRKNDKLKELAMGNMAIDIDRYIKTSAGTPVKTGDMKSETHAYEVKPGKFRVISPKEYSATQEAGRRFTGPGAPTAEFKNYTTAGTRAGWFKRAITAITRHKHQYIKDAATVLGYKV